MEKTNHKEYSHRFLARIVVEAETPLAVGSGEKDIRTDALVATDSNGLPYIPATSIAGVLRSMFGLKDKDKDPLFGFQTDDESHGSELIFTEAKVIDSTGKVIDGMDPGAIGNDPLLSHYQLLPVRQHVRIDGKGVAVDSALFNEQVVFAGTRFCFEIETVSDGSDFNRFEEVLRKIKAADFRLGGGSRSGFGKIKVADMKHMDLDLKDESDLNLYLEKTSALNGEFWNKHANRLKKLDEETEVVSTLLEYKLELKPEDFFLFGSGFSDDTADMTPVKAGKVDWSKGQGRMMENQVLIPGSSMKGALAHRMAFHWNLLEGVFADDLGKDKMQSMVADRNAAVKALFGSEGTGKNNEGISRGNVMVSDMIEGPVPDNILNHVAIDRFTGGTIAGALFSEKASYGKGQSYNTEIVIDKAGLKRACELEWGKTESENNEKKLLEAFEDALIDLCDGMLPLGGGVNRGHGVFNGILEKLDNEGKWITIFPTSNM